MKLSTRVGLLMAALLLLALAGSLLIHTWSARQALALQLELRNRDAATALALALSQQQGDVGALKAVASAHFDMGGYRLLRLVRTDGGTPIELQRSDAAAEVPDWFVKALPMQAPVGSALVTHGWRELGTVQVAAQSAWATRALWQACRWTAGLLLLLGALGAALAALALRAWQRPLQATVAQAQALEQGRFVEAPESGLPELKSLTRSMNAMVRRLRKVFTQQATQLAELQHQALHDGATGLLLRHHFMSRLAALRVQQGGAVKGSAAAFSSASTGKRSKRKTRAGLAAAADAPVDPLSTVALPLAPTHAPTHAPTPVVHSAPRDSGPGLALVMLRLQDLEALNRRLGRAATDRLLAAVAHALLPYVERVEGSFAGRLNGADFALCLPVAGTAQETAQALHAALVVAPALTSASAELSVGALDVPPSMGSSEALAAADEALAHAENGPGWFVMQAAAPRSAADAAAAPGPGAVPVLEAVSSTAAHQAPLLSRAPNLGGAQAWRQQIAQALADNRALLAEYVVCDREGAQVHLECPLRVQLVAGQPYQAAARWLALARRSRLMPQVDLKALDLALVAIGTDQRARAVHVSWPSLAAPGFATEVTRRLRRAPAAARLLSMEWGQSSRPHDWLSLATATQSWRELGVKVAAKHAGAQPQQLVALQELGVDYVKVDPQHLLGVGHEERVRTYAVALVRLIHGLGARAFAAGVTEAQDLAALWACGFDAATGPAVTLAHLERSHSLTPATADLPPTPLA